MSLILAEIIKPYFHNSTSNALEQKKLIKPNVLGHVKTIHDNKVGPGVQSGAALQRCGREQLHQ